MPCGADAILGGPPCPCNRKVYISFGHPLGEETARVARAACPRGNNLAMLMRDHLGMIFDDQQFADLFSPTGQPAASPFRLALTTVLQFTEGLSDRQAADAVRSRID